MSDEQLTDMERQRVISLILIAFARSQGDPELKEIVRKLSGVDAVVYVRKP
jgi:hypothetical protein